MLLYEIYMALEPLTTAAIIGAGASLIGGLFSHGASKHTTKENMKKQHQYDLENMAIANQYNIDAFNRENDYNLPVNQRLRMEQAGLNPNWIDGGTAIASQDSGVMGSSATPYANSLDLQPAINAGVQAYGIEMQRKESAARIDKLNTEIDDLKSQIRKRDGVDTTNTNAQTEEALASAREKATNADMNQKEIDAFEKKLDAYLRNIESSANYQNVMADIASQKLPKELDLLVSQFAKNNADAKKALNDIVIAKAQLVNDTQRVKNDTARVGIESRAQQATANYQQGLLAQGRASLALQRMLNQASTKYMDAQTYEKRLQNVIDYELWLDGVQEDTAKAALREFNEKVRNLKQVYRTNQVKEEFNQWMLRELIRTNDWESIQLQKIFHATPFE